MQEQAKRTTRNRIEYVDPGVLRPAAYNPRTMSEKELVDLERSVGEFGLVDPIIVRRVGKQIIGGHQWLVMAQSLGLERVPFIFLDISEQQAKLLNLALNKVSGDWDQEYWPGSWPSWRRFPISTPASPASPTTRSPSSSGLSMRVRSGGDCGRLTWMPRWTPGNAHTGRNAAISGRWAITASSAATPPTKAMSRGYSMGAKLSLPSLTRPTTWPTATTAASLPRGLRHISQ